MNIQICLLRSLSSEHNASPSSLKSLSVCALEASKLAVMSQKHAHAYTC